MKPHAAVAAVCVRFAGLFMIAASLPQLSPGLERLIQRYIFALPASYPWWMYPNPNDKPGALGWIAVFLLGTYLLLGGHLITRILIRPLLANCQSCGYPLTSIKATRCPECGHENAKAQ